MEKTIYDENNGLWYELRGDYYIPCLTVPAQEERPIGIWGQRHLQYIKKERKALYTELLTSGRLNTYLADKNEQATEQMLLLTKQDGKARRCYRTAKSTGSNAVGTAHEQYPGQGNGDRKPRADLRITHRTAGSNPRRFRPRSKYISDSS